MTGASHAYDERVILDAADLPADDAPAQVIRGVDRRHAHLAAAAAAAGHQGNRADTRY